MFASFRRAWTRAFNPPAPIAKPFDLPPSRERIEIFILGGRASGKTLLAHQLVARLSPEDRRRVTIFSGYPSAIIPLKRPHAGQFRLDTRQMEEEHRG
ncbi:MAG: hypothetical protein ACK4FB_08860 [Brevundimonas sp.]|uniref:hypothetical protein n=1 Tax=Brevundimonas sp. TaxID=1871086 RepID=UPI00391DA483